MKKLSLLLVVFALAGTMTFGQSALQKKSTSSTYTLVLQVTNVKNYTVSINGKQMPQGMEKFKLRSGNYSVLVEAAGYSAYKQDVVLNKNQVLKVTLQKPMQNYTLKVNVPNIPNYTITLNDKTMPKGLNSFKLKQGQYNVVVKADGFYEFNQQVTLNKNQVLNVNMKPMIQNYSLKVNVPNAFDYIITINGKTMPKGLNSFNLKKGEYNVVVKADGFYEFNQGVTLSKNQALNATLTPLPPPVAYVNINIKPEVLNKTMINSINQIKIYDNGTLVNGFYFEATPGQHTIRIESGGFMVQGTYNFETGKTYTIEPLISLRVY